MIKHSGSSEKMAESPSNYHKQEADVMKNLMVMLCDKFQTGPQVVPQIEDCTIMGTAQEVVAESFHGSLMKGFHQEQESFMKAEEFMVPDEHSEAGGDCRPLTEKFGNSKRRMWSSSDEFADEESSDGFTRVVPSVTRKRSKRKRIAETRPNSSDKRPRAEINEKMRVLQKLIPNCNKTDKASVLDKAIEYLKTLQLQLQVMRMGIRPYKPPAMSAFAMHANMNAYMHISYVTPMAIPMGHCSIPVNPVAIPLITPFNSLLSPLIPTTSSSVQPALSMVPCFSLSSFQDFTLHML